MRRKGCEHSCTRVAACTHPSCGMLGIENISIWFSGSEIVSHRQTLLWTGKGRAAHTKCQVSNPGRMCGSVLLPVSAFRILVSSFRAGTVIQTKRYAFVHDGHTSIARPPELLFFLHMQHVLYHPARAHLGQLPKLQDSLLVTTTPPRGSQILLPFVYVYALLRPPSLVAPTSVDRFNSLHSLFMRPKRHEWRTRPPQPPDVNEKLVRDEIEVLNEEFRAQATQVEVSTMMMILERLKLLPRLQLQMGSLEAVFPGELPPCSSLFFSELKCLLTLTQRIFRHSGCHLLAPLSMMYIIIRTVTDNLPDRHNI